MNVTAVILLSILSDLVPIRVEAPAYPFDFVKANLSGTVQLAVCIRPDGSVASADTVGFAVPGISHVASLAAKQWRYPSSLDGRDRTTILRFDFVVVSEPPHEARTIDCFVGPPTAVYSPPSTMVVIGVYRPPYPTVLYSESQQ